METRAIERTRSPSRTAVYHNRLSPVSLSITTPGNTTLPANPTPPAPSLALLEDDTPLGVPESPSTASLYPRETTVSSHVQLEGLDRRYMQAPADTTVTDRGLPSSTRSDFTLSSSWSVDPATAHSLQSLLETENLDLPLTAQEPYASSSDLFDPVLTDGSGEEGCLCISDLLHSLRTRADSAMAKTGSLEALRALNEVSERLLLCSEHHTNLWYFIILALYHDTEERLLSVEDGPRGRGKEPPGAPDPMVAPETRLNRTDPRIRPVFKAFTVLSTVAASLPFRLQLDLNTAPDLDLMTAFTKRLQDRFGQRLHQTTTSARLEPRTGEHA